MSHCRNPSACSVCLGAVPRRVELVNGAVVIDGHASRAAVLDTMTPATRASSLRGGRATKAARRKR